MEFHRIANVFPLLPDNELTALAADIRANGLYEPITTYEGAILDGRNRYTACIMAEVEPQFQPYTGDDPLGFVVSMNMARRHLDESQRAMCAARIANMRQGRPEINPANLPDLPNISQAQAAKTLNVSERSLRSAASVMEHGTPEMIAAVDAGKLSVTAALRATGMTETEQGEVVRIISDEHIRAQEAMRRVRATSIAQHEAVMPSGKFRVFYADPPWSYGNTQPDYHPEQRDHYPVVSMAEICALPVMGLSMDNAVLFLWVTSPILEESFQVVKAWGFQYKASFVWDKVGHNMGHYNSVRHELLLVCVRGSCQPDVRKLYDSVVTEERTEHSRKPALFYDIIESLYTSGPYLELFAREKRAGWVQYGFEST